MYLKRIKILNEEVVFTNGFYGLCVKELYHKHKDHQTLKMEMDEMKIKKRIWEKESVVHEKVNGMYKHMNTLTADDWKTEGK